jgi:hypothetical protein
MQSAETVLGVLRERGRRGLPCDELYRQLFNPQLYLLAYGRLYSNHGAMTPGANEETVDGMSLGKIGRIIDALRHERYRWTPVKRIYIPKKNGKKRPLGLPSWSDKLVGITSLTAQDADTAEVAAHQRGHWGIENRTHYVRDVTFGEDHSQLRTGHAPHNLATLPID